MSGRVGSEELELAGDGLIIRRRDGKREADKGAQRAGLPITGERLLVKLLQSLLAQRLTWVLRRLLVLVDSVERSRAASLHLLVRGGLHLPEVLSLLLGALHALLRDV